MGAVIAFVVGGVVALAGLGAWAVFVAPYRYRLTRRTLALPGAPNGAQGITILHLSDLHFRQDDEKKLQFLRSLAKEAADFVVITGDLIEDDGGRENCIAALSVLKGRYGTYAVLGSHDYHRHRFRDVVRHMLIPGDRSAVARNSVDRLVDELRAAGIHILRNESRRVDVNGRGVRIVGLEDPYVKRHDLKAAVNGLTADEFKILLVHTPDILEEASALGVNLTLSGHTHGGQVRLPLIGALVTHCALPARYAAGVFTLDGMAVHINNGVGVGRFTEIRFLCPPEVTLLTITSKT